MNRGSIAGRSIRFFSAPKRLYWLFLEWKMLQENFVDEIKTHILCPMTFSKKICHLWEYVEKYCGVGQATGNHTAHAHCMLDISGYKHTHSLCNNYCFSTATKVARTRRDITLHTHCLPCYFKDRTNIQKQREEKLQALLAFQQYSYHGL